MRTVFVNPKRRRRKKTTKRSRPRRNATMANPRRRRRRTTPRRRRTYRRRRRNAGIAPFTAQSNPLILSNPRRRRRRNPRMNLKKILNDTMVYMGGGALGYGVTQFGLSQIQNDWIRRGMQAGTAVLGATFLKGNLGASFAGAVMYPLIADLAMYTGLVAIPTSADLDELSADLESALLEASLEDDELYIDDFQPAGGELYDW